MRKMKSLIKTLPIPDGIRDLFDDSALLVSEDAQTYWNLVSAIADDVKPCGPIEWLRVKDIVSFTLDIERLRRLKYEITEIARRARADKIAIDLYQKRTPAEMTPAECAQAAEEYRKSCEESEAKTDKERAEFEALSPEVREAWINFIEVDTRARRPEIEKIQPLVDSYQSGGRLSQDAQGSCCSFRGAHRSRNETAINAQA